MASENGWEPSPRIDPNDPLLVWRTVPGSDVKLQVRNDHAGTAMLAYAADYHAYVEPLVDRMTACYTPTNSVSTSNHLNATAMDFNWDYYPWKKRGKLNGDKLARLRDLLSYWRGIMFWAGDWSDAYVDEMHHQMDYGSYDLERSGQLGQWIKDHIRPDGFSTYKRGDTPPPPPQLSKADQYALAVIAEGRRRNFSPRGIQIALSVPFVESGWKMYANSNVPESMNIPHDAVGTDHDSVGLFQQRCPMWGPAEVLMDPAESAGLFYDRLAKLNYDDTSRAPGDYAADVQRPAAQYRGRYQERMGDAVALYNRLANVTGDDELSAEAERKIDVIYQELTKKFVSRSPLRMPGEGPLDTLAGFDLYTNASTDIQIVRYAAGLGHPPTLNRLRAVANLDPNQYPDRADDAKLAQAILADIETQPGAAPQQAAAEPQIVYVDRPVPAPVVEAPRALAETNGAEQSTGQIIGAAYDALQQLRLADALPIEDRAPLAALIAVLQTKNGSELK